ncbi:hypothetical protein Athai_35480 [Actinocatenispora thailandica]|uniref:Uncharacterized protein n=1 Tax=Actinocatenispora thailandica TaxID=227318 RepID=A0A7R7DQK0_9ACTN|nr:hypothetical protein [Actinocatenispora thailandica]BCJ36045.1 hypothetical protein Athai_35480 [Actinocatenispora thailandica]
MPSLVESLGARLREIGQQLPLPELTRAATQLRDATERCGYMMRESGHADWLGQLTLAGSHLDSAIAATRSVLTELDGYLTGIGIAGVASPGPAPVAAARARSTPGDTEPDVEPVLALRSWWQERVDVLTGRPADEQRPQTVRTDGDRGGAAPEEPADALGRLSAAARGGRDAYRDALLATHPATGMALAAPADRAARRLGAELAGHPLGPDDAKRLTARGAGRITELLPELPPELPAELVGQLCDPFGARHAAAQRHPVDAVVGWPILVGELLRALGATEDRLPELTATARQRPDETLRRDGR